MHDCVHTFECTHAHLRYCPHCGVVYCLTCRREWGSYYWGSADPYRYTARWTTIGGSQTLGGENTYKVNSCSHSE
jgi:hypothetical protein